MTKDINYTANDELNKCMYQVEDFLNMTMDARRVSERCRDYYDGYQWTDDEVATLRSRYQSAIVVNRIKPKVEGLKGLLSIRKTDIKAFPRNMKSDEHAAHAITDALRFVSKAADFDTVKADAFENKIIEGYCAVNVEVERNEKDEIDIKINLIPWDRFYFDPHSYRKDFKDARYMGEMVWLDKDQLVEMFPDKENQIQDLAPFTGDTDLTFQDKPKWQVGDKQRKRYRIVKHYYISRGVWKMAIFTEGLFLFEPEDCGYLNEDGKPACPIEADSCYIDRELQRYSEVKGFMDQQDEINHRRSKALHLLSSRQSIARTGAIADIDVLKRELAKPDGHIQVNGDNKDFELLNNNDFTEGQLALYQDAKAEMDATSYNAQLAGERQNGDLSGKAIDRLQSAGAIEIDTLYRTTNNWENRVFRQVWARVKQFWNEEKWIRVTDNQDNLRWVGLNTQVTLQQMLEDIINDESKPQNLRMGASSAFQQMMQAQDPRLQTIVDVKNRTPELDIDVTLEQSFDVVNIQQEQFELLAQFAQGSQDVDIVDLIELSQLRNKKELIEKIEQRRAANAQANAQAIQAQVQTEQTKNAKTFADAQQSTEKARQLAIENEILIKNPVPVSATK